MLHLMRNQLGAIIGAAEPGGVAAWIMRNDWNGEHCFAADPEPVEPDCSDVEAILEGIATRLGLTAAFSFVPMSQSRNAKPGTDGKVWQSLNWKVELKRNGRPVMVSDYSQGSGHAPATKLKAARGRAPTRYDNMLKDRAIAAECETGRAHTFGEGLMFDSRTGIRDTRKPIDPPSFGDVLQSLARDSDVLDSGGFEAWASELGYDPDSRKAESIYRECLESALKLQGAIGFEALAELRAVAAFN